MKHADHVQTHGPRRSAQGFPEAVLAPRRRRQQGTERSDTESSCRLQPRWSRARDSAAGGSGLIPSYRARLQLTTRTGSGAGLGAPERRGAFTLRYFCFRASERPGKGEEPRRPSGPQYRGGSRRSDPVQSQFGGGQRRSQWSLPDLDPNTGYPCGRARTWGEAAPPPHRPPRSHSVAGGGRQVPDELTDI